MSDRSDSAALGRFIDLHSHTNESDGSLTPEELVGLAKRNDLDALAITDHDTFAGYEKAVPFARQAGLDLVRGIELNTRLNTTLNLGDRYDRPVHVLAYFPMAEPSQEILGWLDEQREERQNRNRRLAEELQRRGVDISVEEVERRGRTLAGRVHFAQVLVEKGYAADSGDAFRRYLGEEAPTYVPRESKTIEDAMELLRAGSGIPVLAHPIRLALDRDAERELMIRLKRRGLMGLEIYHSEHSPEMQAHYRQLAEELELLPTGGSDFHGAAKPDIDLGTGMNGNVRVPREFLDRMRESRPHA